MKRPTVRDLEVLFRLLDFHAPDLKAPCRWLVVGPDLAAVILDDARPPEVEDLTRLMRLIKQEGPQIEDLGLWLVAESEQSAATHVELQLDQLIEANPKSWAHPIQVLERPRADFESLLRACKLRLLSAQGPRRERLEGVHTKLETSVRIATSARRRRQEMERKKQNRLRTERRKS